MEWNPNSVAALRENLRMAQVPESRVTVYCGDNALHAPSLVNTADVVCLGLLPSSVKGWPLGASILRSEGGVLHVHENVNDFDIEQWTASTVGEFVEFFQQLGKPMKVVCRKLERVKSYAPHVIHVVADLVCTPYRL
jgi:tRNA wybutosine-synthesizing protein 3